MNKIFLLLSLVLILLGCESDNIELVLNGKSDFTIFVADDAIPAEKYAAGELQKTIQVALRTNGGALMRYSVSWTRLQRGSISET